MTDKRHEKDLLRFIIFYNKNPFINVFNFPTFIKLYINKNVRN